MAEKTAQKSNQIVKLALVLFAIAAVIALVLGLVNEVTKDKIAAQKEEKTKTAYSNVLPADDYSEEIPADDLTITKLVAAKNGDERVGYVAETSFSGAQGMIEMVVGLNPDLTCSGVYIIKHAETSGLGAKAAETHEGAWRDKLVGAGAGAAVNKDGGTIEAISGATITSRSVVNEILAVIAAVEPQA